MQVEPLTAGRLELVWLSPADGQALLDDRSEALAFTVPDGYPSEHDRRFYTFRLKQVEEGEAPPEWLPRAIVLRHENRMIGHIGFHGAPGRNARKDPHAVEVGYTVFPDYRRQGYATEAVRAILDWARDQDGVERVIASISPDNGPSLAIALHFGFVEVGRHLDDEDGLELEFELSFV